MFSLQPRLYDPIPLRFAVPDIRPVFDSYREIIPRKRWFFEDYFNEPRFSLNEDFFNEELYGLKDDFKDENDKYIINLHTDKDVNIDFLKKENQLKIQMSETTENSSSEYSKIIQFPKKVKPEGIKASVINGEVRIEVPKVEPDSSNILKVQIEGKKGGESKEESKEQIKGNNEGELKGEPSEEFKAQQILSSNK